MSKLQQAMFAELQTKALFTQSQSAAFDYIDKVFELPVSPNQKQQSQLAQFDHALPNHACDPKEIIQLLATIGSSNTAKSTGGRYFGFVNGNALPITLATKWLSTVWDQNAALHVMSPISAKLEAVCETWLKELFDLPKTTVAGFVSGTSIATLAGLAAARFRQFQKLGWDINQDGMCGAPKLRLILGTETHGTVVKAINLLGFGRASIEWVESDEQGRIMLDKLPKLDTSCILVIQAGNVNTGAFDNFSELCRLASVADAWVHVDGAFGLWAKASIHFEQQTRGLHLADSWSVDAHKTLNTPYDCGIVLCKDSQALTTALHQQGSYIQLSEQRDGLLYTPEMSKRARAIELWAAIKYLGRSGMAELVELLHQRALLFADLLTANQFEVLNDVVFNQVICKCETDLLTQQTLAFVQHSAQCWCGGATWKGQNVIRISLCSWATTEKDVINSVDTFVQARLEAHKV